MIWTLTQVAIGGAIGSCLRYLTNVGAMRVFGPGFPVSTMAVNIFGCFMMGIVVEFLSQKGGMRFAPLLMTGVLGGFTTFSAFSLDAVTIYERGQPALALFYVAGSVILSLAAILLAMHLLRGAFA